MMGIDVEQSIECFSKSAPVDDFMFPTRPRTLTTPSSNVAQIISPVNKPRLGQTFSAHFSSSTNNNSKKTSQNNETHHKSKLFGKLMNTTGIYKNKQQQHQPQPRSSSINSPRQKSLSISKRKSHDQDDFVIV